jgi:tRNA modification GTPase
MSSKTISAIATPSGRGGVGIVRVSGPASREILETLVPDWPAECDSHRLRLSQIHDTDGELIDESLAVLMEGPKTYTGEDVVEFQCHGGPIILRRVLDATLEAGATTAEPGEFTRRAFLNGRLDLTQAEAVADLVNATSESAHKMALEHLQGRLGQSIEAERERVAEALTLVEAAIDFAHEEHVYQIERDEILERLNTTIDELQRLEDQFDRGRRQREGVRVVILGPTNAGKSTLFNALYGSDRAIVTPVAGTTRDFLEEELHLEGVALRVMDTAGLRDTEDQVESIGIERSRELKDKADLAIWVVDRSEGLTEEARQELAELEDSDTPTIAVLNKMDLEDALTDADRELLDSMSHVHQTRLAAPDEETADDVSADAVEGLEELTDTLAQIAERLTDGEGVLLSRARHLESVRSAREHLEQARRAVRQEMDHEFVALDLRDGLDDLGEIVGEVSTDDILGRIFSEFCVGK